MGNLLQREERCQGQKRFFVVRNVFKIKWSLLKKTESDPLGIDAHVVDVSKSFLPHLSKTEKSFGTSRDHRPYENMSLINFLVSIFRVCLYCNQDMSCPEMGKRI
jgi:hypothetical protein